MTYRIRRAREPDRTVFGLSGELDAEHASRLEDYLAEEDPESVLLDLREITFVAREAIGFLARAEARGIRIVNCPEYVRSWIAADESGQTENSV